MPPRAIKTALKRIRRCSEEEGKKAITLAIRALRVLGKKEKSRAGIIRGVRAFVGLRSRDVEYSIALHRFWHALHAPTFTLNEWNAHLSRLSREWKTIHDGFETHAGRIVSNRRVILGNNLSPAFARILARRARVTRAEIHAIHPRGDAAQKMAQGDALILDAHAVSESGEFFCGKEALSVTLMARGADVPVYVRASPFLFGPRAKKEIETPVLPIHVFQVITEKGIFPPAIFLGELEKQRRDARKAFSAFAQETFINANPLSRRD